ncbi:MAG: pilus assembly protein PilP [Syntrophaceae bacterium]
MKKNKTAANMLKIFLTLITVMCVSVVTAADRKDVSTRGMTVKTPDTKVSDLQTVPAYRYNPAGKPDPFKPFIEKEIAVKKKLEIPKPPSIFPLQRAPVEHFRLVGVAGNDRRIGMVQDAKEKFFPIFVGTQIGMNGGRVVQILADRIIVEEKIKADAKQSKTKRITLKLRKDEGEGRR